MYVNQYELDVEAVEYFLDNPDELDDVLFAGLTTDEVLEIEASLLDDWW